MNSTAKNAEIAKRIHGLFVLLGALGARGGSNCLKLSITEVPSKQRIATVF
jgi:hypothetical protein